MLTISFRPPYNCNFTKCQFKKDPYVGNIRCEDDLVAIFQITIFFVAVSFLCSLSRLWCFHYGHISDRHVLRRLISVLPASCKLWFQESHFCRIFFGIHILDSFIYYNPLASIHLWVLFYETIYINSFSTTYFNIFCFKSTIGQILVKCPILFQIKREEHVIMFLGYIMDE